ncbi:hypothetical protein GCM10008101_10700 [Lysobacter xinjiangensis]|uniref:Uncharacterized protein n=1 Tax=Cognatilysobacter xinjiangensis TaxID=546892 RepID=A0ABQ3BVG2_9GAMM|nr:hypothetical protein GCM10008101_10700 [Lysobacter xinjiangensis]
MAEMQRAVGIGQGAGDEDLAGHGCGVASGVVKYRMQAPRGLGTAAAETETARLPGPSVPRM